MSYIVLGSSSLTYIHTLNRLLDTYETYYYNKMIKNTLEKVHHFKKKIVIEVYYVLFFFFNVLSETAPGNSGKYYKNRY